VHSVGYDGLRKTLQTQFAYGFLDCILEMLRECFPRVNEWWISEPIPSRDPRSGESVPVARATGVAKAWLWKLEAGGQELFSGDMQSCLRRTSQRLLEV